MIRNTLGPWGRGSFWALLLVAAALAGCSQPSPAPPDEPAPTADCSGTSVQAADGSCIALDDLEVALDGCVESAFNFELDREVYPLPPGYGNSPFGASPQRVAVSLDRCAGATYAGRHESNVTMGFVAVIVQAPPRGQEAAVDDYDLELLVDSPGLSAILAAARFPVVNASVQVTGSPPLRQAEAHGGVDYVARAEFADVPGGVMHFSDAHHGPDWWYLRDRLCDIYGGAALVQLDAAKGELVKAAPPAGPLEGRGTQSKTCDVAVTFGGHAR